MGVGDLLVGVGDLFLDDADVALSVVLERPNERDRRARCFLGGVLGGTSCFG